MRIRIGSEISEGAEEKRTLTLIIRGCRAKPERQHGVEKHAGIRERVLKKSEKHRRRITQLAGKYLSLSQSFLHFVFIINVNS